MNYTIGDGLVAFALAGGIVGYLYIKHRSQQSKIEIIHQERMAAMEKGIPLPEFPFEPERKPGGDPENVIPILGTVLSTLSLGAMIVLYTNLPGSSSMWVAPLPFTFLGVGLVIFHFLKSKTER